MDKIDTLLTAGCGVMAMAGAYLPPEAAKWSFVVAGAAFGALIAVFGGRKLKIITASDDIRGALAVHFSIGVAFGYFASDWARKKFPAPDFDPPGVTMMATAATSILAVTVVVYVLPPVKTWIKNLIPKRSSDPKP